MSSSRTPVRVLTAGAALTVGLSTACTGPAPTENPPAPEQPVDAPEVEPVPTANPPPALPTWDEVESGHPQGATNPPMPVLVARIDGSECWKTWYDPRAVPMEARAKGGLVLEPGQAPPERTTPIQCPQDQLQELLQHHAQAQEASQAEGQD